MTNQEIDEFIERCEEFGDDGWTPESVRESSYGAMSLDDAIAARRSCYHQLSDIMSKVMNR